MKSAFHRNRTMKMMDRRYFFDLDMNTAQKADYERGRRLIVIAYKDERRAEFFPEGGA